MIVKLLLAATAVCLIGIGVARAEGPAAITLEAARMSAARELLIEAQSRVIDQAARASVAEARVKQLEEELAKLKAPKTEEPK